MSSFGEIKYVVNLPETLTIDNYSELKVSFLKYKYHAKWKKAGNMLRFTIEFLFQYLNILIEISKYSNKILKAKHIEIPTFHLIMSLIDETIKNKYQ